MDMLPVNPASTNKVDTGINLANDGGSKSNTGYYSQRESEEHKPEEKLDEVSFSHKNKTEEIEEEEQELNFFEKILKFFADLKDSVLKLLGLKKQEIPNIYEKTGSTE